MNRWHNWKWTKIFKLIDLKRKKAKMIIKRRSREWIKERMQLAKSPTVKVDIKHCEGLIYSPHGVFWKKCWEPNFKFENRLYPQATQLRTSEKWCGAANICLFLHEKGWKTVINLTKMVDFLYTGFFLRLYRLKYWIKHVIYQFYSVDFTLTIGSPCSLLCSSSNKT